METDGPSHSHLLSPYFTGEGCRLCQNGSLRRALVRLIGRECPLGMVCQLGKSALIRTANPVVNSKNSCGR